MSLWAKSQSLPNEALKQIRAAYNENQFPIEVRHFMSSWIEAKMNQLNELDANNPNHLQFAQNLMTELLQEIECKLKHETDFLMRARLEEASNLFTTQYSNNPMALVSVLRNGLNLEINLVRQQEMASAAVNNRSMGASSPLASANARETTNNEIVEQLGLLMDKTSESAQDLRALEQEQESFLLGYHDCTKTSAQLAHLSSQPPNPQMQEMIKNLEKKKQVGESELSVKASRLVQQRMALVDKLKETVERLTGLQQRVLDQELISWKREQQMAGNGRPFDENRLNIIQEWCEQLAEIIWQNRHQIRECERLCTKLPLQAPGGVDLLPELNQHITGLLSSLVTSTFIIEKEPTQVLKTNTKFSATVRLLVGGKLNVYMTPPQVRVSIINEQQANALLKNDTVSRNESSGEILNSTGTMEYVQNTRQLSVNFRNMQLKRIKRAEKKGSESVMDEKFALLFQSQFSVGGGELLFEVWTLSLPVVVIVHGNQEPHAWATILWDNAFSEQGRVLFTVPDKVLWPQVADMLDTVFKSSTGRGLTPDNLQYLAGKAFRNPDMVDFSNMALSWSLFCKEPLPLADKSFTFWEWFFQVKKVTKDHLKQPWVDGSILGFVGRKQAEEMLQASPSDTFLLRFSDSELGGVTIAWTFKDKAQDQRDVFMLQPFTGKDFAIRPLADRISDLEYLNFLYPDIPKDKAFSKYYTPVGDNTRNTPNGYVRYKVVTHVPGFPKHGSNDMGYPGSPSGGNMGSPMPSGPPSVSSVSDQNYGMMQGQQMATGLGAGQIFIDEDILNSIQEALPEHLPDCDISDLNIDFLNSQINFNSGNLANFSNMEM